jgi:hypothetical protein
MATGKRIILVPRPGTAGIHEERMADAAARCFQAVIASNAVTKATLGQHPQSVTGATSVAADRDLDALAAFVNRPPGSQRAIQDTCGSRCSAQRSR